MKLLEDAVGCTQAMSPSSYVLKKNCFEIQEGIPVITVHSSNIQHKRVFSYVKYNAKPINNKPTDFGLLGMWYGSL